MKLSFFFYKKDVLNFIDRSIRSSFFKNVGVLTIGTIIANGITILVTPILSRLFTPDDYGLFTLFSAVLVIISTIVSLCYPILIILPKSNKEAFKLVLISLYISVILGIFILIITKFLPKLVFTWLGLYSLEGLIFLVIIAGIVLAISNSLIYWLNRFAEYKKIAFVRIIQSFTAAIASILLGFYLIPNGLILAQVIGVFILLIFLLFLTKINFFNFGFFELFKVASKHKKAPFFLYPTAILDVFSNQLPFFLIAIWFTTELTGQFKMAYSLLAMPAALVGSAISQVFYQRFSKLWPDAIKARVLLKKTWLFLAVLGFFPFFIISIKGGTIFSFLLGEKWIAAGHIASILAIMSYFSLIHSPTSVTMMTMKMEKLLPLFGLATIIHRPLAIYFGYVVSNIYFGLLLYVLFELLHMACFQYLVLRRLNLFIKLKENQIL
ncbi:oligosaccharide flippase family protein [bacterium]|nr:oligosaccharide flippase family protein [bacterium]